MYPERLYIHKQTWGFLLQVCWLLWPFCGHQALKVKFHTSENLKNLEVYFMDFLLRNGGMVHTCYIKLKITMIKRYVIWLTKERVLALFPATNTLRGLTFTKPDTTQAEYEPPQNLNSDSVECMCAKITLLAPFLGN